MKQEIRTIKGFDTVKYFREIKEKISKDIVNMTYAELCQYLGQAPEQVKIKDAS